MTSDIEVVFHLILVAGMTLAAIGYGIAIEKRITDAFNPKFASPTRRSMIYHPQPFKAGLLRSLISPVLQARKGAR